MGPSVSPGPTSEDHPARQGGVHDARGARPLLCVLGREVRPAGSAIDARVCAWLGQGSSPWMGDSRVCMWPLQWGPHPHSQPEAPETASPVNQSVGVYSGGAHTKMALRRGGFTRRGTVTAPGPTQGCLCPPGEGAPSAAGSPFWTHEVTMGGRRTAWSLSAGLVTAAGSSRAGCGRRPNARPTLAGERRDAGPAARPGRRETCRLAAGRLGMATPGGPAVCRAPGESGRGSSHTREPPRAWASCPRADPELGRLTEDFWLTSWPPCPGP